MTGFYIFMNEVYYNNFAYYKKNCSNTPKYIFFFPLTCFIIEFNMLKIIKL